MDNEPGRMDEEGIANLKPDIENKKIEAEIRIKEAELALKREELQARLAADKKSSWFSSPLVLAVSTAIFGLLGTGVGAALQGYWNTHLERQKFESTLIQKALDTTDKNQAANNLLFLVNAGLIQQLDRNKIQEMAGNPDTLPLSTHQAIRLGEITVHEAKRILKDNGYYQGDINDVEDTAFSDAVSKFQKAKNLFADGALGLKTNDELKKLKNKLKPDDNDQ